MLYCLQGCGTSITRLLSMVDGPRSGMGIFIIRLVCASGWKSMKPLYTVYIFFLRLFKIDIQFVIVISFHFLSQISTMWKCCILILWGKRNHPDDVAISISRCFEHCTLGIQTWKRKRDGESRRNWHLQELYLLDIKPGLFHAVCRYS